MQADDPKELFDPAINGTVGVLKSIQKNNPKVQRVVITRYAHIDDLVDLLIYSSVAAVMDARVEAPHTYVKF